jgi:TonB family protein
MKLADPNVAKGVYDRITGTVVATVAVTLDTSGNVIAATIYQSSGDAALDQAAIDAAKRSTYSPGAADCKPAGGTFAVQFQFEGKRAADATCPHPARVVGLAAPDGSAIRTSGLWQNIVVAVEVTIDPNGKLVEARVVQSSGNMALDQAALNAARQSTYEPKMEATPIRRQASAGHTGDEAGVVCRAVQAKYLFRVTFSPY